LLLLPPPFKKNAPAPCITSVSSFDTVTFFALPMCSTPAFSSFRPTSSLTTVPPVSSAMSCRFALRLSPKPGALTAQTLRPPRSLLSTSEASASDSQSSAMMSSGLLSRTITSSSGRMLCSVETFFSTMRM